MALSIVGILFQRSRVVRAVVVGDLKVLVVLRLANKREDVSRVRGGCKAIGVGITFVYTSLFIYVYIYSKYCFRISRSSKGRRLAYS